MYNQHSLILLIKHRFSMLTLPAAKRVGNPAAMSGRQRRQRVFGVPADSERLVGNHRLLRGIAWTAQEYKMVHVAVGWYADSARVVHANQLVRLDCLASFLPCLAAWALCWCFIDLKAAARQGPQLVVSPFDEQELAALVKYRRVAANVG